MVHGLVLGLVLSCGASTLKTFETRPAAQDVEDLTRRLKATLLERESRYYTPEQIEELTALATGYLGRVGDPVWRAKLAHDLERYLHRRSDEHTLTWVVPLPKPAGGTEVYRTPALWELFKHELDQRVGHALRREAPKEITPLVRQQIDRILLAVRVRLSGVFEGPGAERYLKSLLERYEKSLVEDASSELEFSFSRPLTAQELADLEREIAVFKPSPAPELVKDPPPQRASDPSRVWIEDPEKPPLRAISYGGMGVWSMIRSAVIRIFYPPDFLRDPKADALFAKADLETDELVATLRALRGPLDLSKAAEKPVIPSEEAPPGAACEPSPKRLGHPANVEAEGRKGGSKEVALPEAGTGWWPAFLAVAIVLVSAIIIFLRSRRSRVARRDSAG